MTLGLRCGTGYRITIMSARGKKYEDILLKVNWKTNFYEIFLTIFLCVIYFIT